MGSSARMAGRVAAVALRGGAVLVAAVPSVAQAESVRQAIRVPCSAPALSTAISAANAAPATLRLAAGCTYQLTGTLTVTGTVALFGGPSTAIASSGFTGPLIDVTATGRLRVQGIFLQGGRGAPGQDGGGIRNAGGLVLNFVTLRDNATANGNGGGLANLQTARALIAHTVITRNLATGSGVAGSGMGGGVLNRGAMTLFASRVSANTAEDSGGGIAGTGTTRVVQSTVDRNDAAGNGGGILSSGTTSLDRTLVVLNRAGSGGGVFRDGGTVTVRRTIIRRNTPDDCAPAGSVPGCG